MAADREPTSAATRDRQLLPYFAGYREPRHYPSAGLTVINGLPVEWKRERPSLGSHPSVLYGWLAGYFAADGDVGKTGRPTLASADRDSLSYVRALCSLIGVGTFGIRQGDRIGYRKEATPLYLVGLMRGDLTEDFFIIEEHRRRWLAGRGAGGAAWLDGRLGGGH